MALTHDVFMLSHLVTAKSDEKDISSHINSRPNENLVLLMAERPADFSNQHACFDQGHPKEKHLVRKHFSFAVGIEGGTA